jgi:hypothetical protein
MRKINTKQQPRYHPAPNVALTQGGKIEKNDAINIPNPMNLKLFVSQYEESISRSVCICMLLSNVSKHKDVIKNNIAYLQKHFNQSFIVFVNCTSSDSTEDDFSNIDNSMLINTNEKDEYNQRNIYLKFVHENKQIFNLLMVIDPLTCLISPLNIKSFEFLRDSQFKFSAVFANQSYKYYDIDNLISNKIDRQTHISRYSEPLAVESAFGGFGIYNMNIIELDNKYASDNHISFNLNISKKHGNMFLLPSFIIETSSEIAYLYD